MTGPVLSRRRLLALVMASAAARTAAGCADASEGGLERVAVIGAGFSGLTVANALSAAGVEVEVLEARERIGGRTWTAALDGARVDLGGSWIHGPEGNPVACFARDHGIGWRSAEVVQASTAVYDSAAGFVAPADLVTFLLAESGFEEQIGDLRRALGPGASVAAGIDLYLDREGLAGASRRYADFAIRQGIAELFYGGPADRMALDQIFEDGELAGGNHFPDGGFGRLVDLLAEGLTIRLGHVVDSISWGSSGVRVRSNHGSHRASHVVVTVPVGVLQSGRIAFDPPLPAVKQSAIDRLDMGNLEKVVLLFDEPVWSETDRANVIYLSQRDGEFPIFFDLTPYLGRPGLLCFCGGQFARDVAGAPESEVVDRVLGILAEIRGSPAPTPTHAAVTRWRSDPYALGSYSYLPVGATPADMAALAAPAGERLLFAGEATVPEFYGTVHAAMLSGLREARRLLGRAPIDLVGRPAPGLGCV